MSYIHFHAEANSIEDLKRQLREALGDEQTIQLNLCDDGIHELNLGTNLGVAGTPGETRVSSSIEPDREQDEQPEQPAKTYELAEVRAAANAYRDRHGIEKLRDVFRLHGGEKLKDIPEGSYAALMEDIT